MDLSRFRRCQTLAKGHFRKCGFLHAAGDLSGAGRCAPCALRARASSALRPLRGARCRARCFLVVPTPNKTRFLGERAARRSKSEGGWGSDQGWGILQAGTPGSADGIRAEESSPHLPLWCLERGRPPALPRRGFGLALGHGQRGTVRSSESCSRLCVGGVPFHVCS